jgi:hypothetical protein
MKFELSRQGFEKYSNLRCHENPSSSIRSGRQTQTDRRTNMTKPVVVFVNYVNAPKNEYGNLGNFCVKLLFGRTRIKLWFILMCSYRIGIKRFVSRMNQVR